MGSSWGLNMAVYRLKEATALFQAKSGFMTRGVAVSGPAGEVTHLKHKLIESGNRFDFMGQQYRFLHTSILAISVCRLFSELTHRER